MLFSWKKKRKKEKIFFNKNNNDLIKELKEKGINNKSILDFIHGANLKSYNFKKYRTKARVF